MPGTSTLVIETSTPAASLAFADAVGNVVLKEFTSDRSHNALLFDPLKQLVAEQVPGGIGMVLAGSGPGSYSGTRVGISAAQGVALAHGCPAVAFPSILGVPQAENGAPYLTVGDARRGSYWTCAASGYELESEPALTDAAGLQAAVDAAIAAGHPVISFEDPSRYPLEAATLERVRLGFPSASLLWRAWTNTSPGTRAHWSSQAPQPMYLRPPHITPAKRSWLQRKPED